MRLSIVSTTGLSYRYSGLVVAIGHLLVHYNLDVYLLQPKGVPWITYSLT